MLVPAVLGVLATPASGASFSNGSFSAPSPGAEWELDSSPGAPWLAARFQKGEATISLAFEPSPEPDDPEQFVREPFAVRSRELGYEERVAQPIRTAKGHRGFLLEYVDSRGRKHFAQAAIRLKRGMVSATLTTPDDKTYELERAAFLKMVRAIRSSRGR